MATAHLVDSEFPRYISELSSFKDVLLLSNDGFHFSVNSGLLASSSSLTSSAWVGLLGDLDVSNAFSTELSKTDLGHFLNFITQGLCPEDLSEDARRGFLSLGVDLDKIKLERVCRTIAQKDFTPKENEIKPKEPACKYGWSNERLYI